MTEQTQFTIEQFCRNMSQGKLTVGICKKCGKKHFPPRPVCDVCFSEEFEWAEVAPQGKLLTYTIIHIAPTQFQPLAPYAVGIVELEDCLRIPGIIREAPLEQIKVGMSLTMAFEACSPTAQWPQWPRYHFKPM